MFDAVGYCIKFNIFKDAKSYCITFDLIADTLGAMHPIFYMKRCISHIWGIQGNYPIASANNGRRHIRFHVSNASSFI